MRISLTLTVLLVIGLAVTPALGSAQEEPNFTVVIPEPTLAPGQQSELTVLVTNEAADAEDDVEPAENVAVELEGANTPISVHSGPRRLGTLVDGDVRDVAFRITVPQHIAPGEYELTLTVTYEHDDERETQSIAVPVRVDDYARFEVSSESTPISVGDSGIYALTVRNVGSETAYSATMHLESDSDPISFGQDAADTRFIGNLTPGEATTVEYTVSVSEDAQAQPYAATVTISYEDENGILTSAPPKSVGFTPLPETQFSLDEVNSTLWAGEEGEISGDIVNEGSQAVRDLVLTFQPSSPTVTVTEPEYAVGDLSPRERSPFSFEVDVSRQASAGPRQFTLVPSIRTASGDRREGDSLELRTSVGPQRDAFHVTPINATFASGGSGELTVEVTNNRDQPLSDISAKLFATAPLSADDDEAFIPALEPGESQTVVFTISAADSALEKTYPVEVDFRYRTVDGDTRLSDTYNIPVQIANRESDGLGLIMIGGLVVTLLVVASAYLYRRRTVGAGRAR